MIKKQNIENSTYDNAPPVANQQMNNIPNSQNISNNKNNFPSISSINNINNSLNKNNNNIQDNLIINPNIINNNNIKNHPMAMNPLNKSIYEYNRMFYLNYLNNINLINNNNINNINNINDNYNKINANIYNFKIDITSEILQELKKENLIYLVKFINDYCNLTIDSQFLNLNHEIFQIHKSKKNLNEYILSVKKRIINKILFENNIKKEDEKEDNNKNEENEEKNKKEENIFYCSSHKMNFTNKSEFFGHYFRIHSFKKDKCNKCSHIFSSRKDFGSHRCFKNIDDNKNISNFKQKLNNLNNNIVNSNMIKCTECDLIFNTVEDMTFHYHKIHEIKKLKSNNNMKKVENHKNIRVKDFLNNASLNGNKGQMEDTEENFINKTLEDNIGNPKKGKKKSKKEKKQEENDYECYLDGEKFHNENDYILHFENEHTDDFPFYCYDCQEGFYSNQSIEKHYLSIKH